MTKAPKKVIMKAVNETEEFAKTVLADLFAEYSDDSQELTCNIGAALSVVEQRILEGELDFTKKKKKPDPEPDDDDDDDNDDDDDAVKSAKAICNEICKETGSVFFKALKENHVSESGAKLTAEVLCCGLAASFGIEDRVAARLIADIIG